MISKIKNKILKYLFSHFEQFEQNKKLALISKFKQVGKNFQIGKDFSIHNPNYMEFGANFSALQRFRIEAWDHFQGQKFTPRIKIGDNVIFNTDIHIGCINYIEIGDNCLFASRIYITDHQHGDTSEGMIEIIPSQRPLVSKGAVVIEKNVWVGEGVVIMPGVTIGENSIIGANSVVTKSVPKNTVYAGIPAKLIKQLV
jgi:acetyltransferase-like isoleucine patch superfamily enzyme